MRDDLKLGEVDTGYDDFGGGLFRRARPNYCAGFGEDFVEWARAGWPAEGGDQAKGAAIVASVLDFQEMLIGMMWDGLWTASSLRGWLREWSCWQGWTACFVASRRQASRARWEYAFARRAKRNEAIQQCIKKLPSGSFNFDV